MFEDDVDAAEGAGGESGNASTASGLRGFCCSPMKVVPSLPAAQPLRPADGLLVSWGRAVAEGERPEDNPWSVDKRGLKTRIGSSKRLQHICQCP